MAGTVAISHASISENVRSVLTICVPILLLLSQSERLVCYAAALQGVDLQLCAVVQQSGLGMLVHCIGGQPLVSVLFVAVLITRFFLKTFYYLYY